ncbi:hypothetical protein HOY80DRAFT_886484, partial [Tuber brumale]
WDSDQLVEQDLKLAILIFKVAFSSCHTQFLFNNTTSHSAYALDALRVSRMNL